jgi:putative endonuclease
MKMFKLYYVYILECSDSSYYIGITSDLNKRLEEHQEGIHEDAYTYKKRPVELRYWESFYNSNAAIAREKQLKGWSRIKKQALIEENIEKLKQLSNQKNIFKRE